MVAEVGLGQPYTPALAVFDANGSPVETGVLGSLSLYGPASATVPAFGPSPLVWQGGPWWGVAVPGAIHSAAGYYRYDVPTLTTPGGSLAGQSGGYTVGLIPPEYRTYRAILVAVCQALDVAALGQTTAAGTTGTLIDSRWADPGYATNEFVDDELVFLEPAVGGPPAVRVVAYAPGSGTFTFLPATFAPQTAQGQDYLLLRPGARGLRLARIKEAIDAAIADLALRQPVSDEVTLTTDGTLRRYSYPATWLDVTRVSVNRVTGAAEEYWETIPPAAYQLWPDRRLLVFRTGWQWDSQGYPLRLEGKVGLPAEYGLGSLVRVPWRAVRDQAVGALTLAPQDAARMWLGQARGAASRLDTRG